MSEWWSRLLHEPISENPWSFGALSLPIVAVLAALGWMWWRNRPQSWRRCTCWPDVTFPRCPRHGWYPPVRRRRGGEQ